MYCGHCGAAVEERDSFCNACGARFVDPALTGPAPAAGAAFLPPAPFAAPPAVAPPPAFPAVGQPAVAFPTAGEPTVAFPMLAPPSEVFGAPEPTQLIPVTTDPPGRSARPFLIGAAFALIVLAGVVAFFLLRGDETTAQPSPSGPTFPVTPTAAPTTSTAPVETTAAPTTTPLTAAPVTTAPTTTLPPETVAPETTVPAGGTVPANTATIPGAPPTTPPPTAVPVTEAPPATRPRTTTPRTTTPRTTTPRTTAVPTTAAPENPPPAGRAPAVSSVRASGERAGGVDSCGQPTSYAPANAVDGRLATAWITQGDGSGQYIELTLATGSQVSQVGLVPGYAKQDPCSGSDRFRDMRRIVEVRWTFDDGTSLDQTLDPESPSMQTVPLPSAVQASTVRLTILTTTDPGTVGFDYSPISEVSLT